MKKILLTLFLLATVQLAHAQFVVSAQLGGSFSQGSSSFESRYDGPSPLTGLDTTIIDTGSFRNNKPLSLSIGAKFGYQLGKIQFGVSAMFGYSRTKGDFSMEEFKLRHPNFENIRILPPYDSLVANFTQYRTQFTIAPYLRYELILLGDIAFFAELDAYFSQVNIAHRHEFLDWYRRELHYTIDTSYSIPESSTSIGCKIVPGLSWQLSPKCYVDLYLDILAFSVDHTIYKKTIVVEEYDYTTTPRVLSRITTTDITAHSNEIGFGINGSPISSNRNWIRVGFNYTF
jgi:hypothetical protein